MKNISTRTQKPACLGFGLGLRPDHYEDILQTRPNLDWFEITSENYMIPGGRPLYYLDRIRRDYPMVMHGVSLSLGSTDPLDMDYLKQLRHLAERVEPAWISDHLCWTGVDKKNTHDLLPLPYTREAIEHVAGQIQRVQDYLGRQIAIENVSSYLTFTQSEMSEWEFISEIVARADCYLLLDVNNIYVSSFNHHFHAMDYINAMPGDRIVQIHLAGHSNYGDYIIDTHDAPVIPAVWDLYAETIKRFGMISTMIERDDNIPPLAELLLEMDIARLKARQALGTEAFV
ncbi:MNIO family bufferin maturase [Legionella sp. CNM-4043-24]|uniref:MNIO family bufferin maturase n=1 Tax=Legionella sp. CNM-4043-24 TaxID=3421646 RepID=UPI00403AD90A